jgi:hypothetical protein
MKTYEDYLKDPALAGEPRALREVHAMRLKVQDEIRGMTAVEQTAYFHEAAAWFFAPETLAHNVPTQTRE